MRTKEYTLLETVIIPYHQVYSTNPDLAGYALANSDDFNVERMVEKLLADVSGWLEFVDGHGYDYLPDHSDMKTATINRNTLVAEVGSIENKIGAIRIVIYNPFLDDCDYMFIPASDRDLLARACYGTGKAHKLRFMIQYNLEQDHFNQFEKYRLPTFAALAAAR